MSALPSELLEPDWSIVSIDYADWIDRLLGNRCKGRLADGARCDEQRIHAGPHTRRVS